MRRPALLWPLIAAIILSSCSTPERHTALHEKLTALIDTIDAHVGVAVIIDGRDTISVNGDEAFPMLSVYKFPQALAVASYCRSQGLTPADTIGISPSQLRTDTYSPMRDKYGTDSLRLPLGTVLAYSVQQSDNNACDILFDLTGSPKYTAGWLGSTGLDGINIISTEAEMHADTTLCRANSATPIAMARLVDMFDTSLRHLPVNDFVATLMETCATGTDRLAAGLPANITFGHKTGTGDRTPDGRIMAINDAGYVHLPDGRHYAIVVLVENSAMDMERTAALIARISRMVYDTVTASE